MTILFVANIISTLAKSRRGLIQGCVQRGHRVVIAAPDGSSRTWLKGLAVDYIPLKKLSRTDKNFQEDLGLIFEIKGIFTDFKVDVALLFNIKPVIYGSIAARFGSVQVLSTITGTGNVFLQSPLLRRILISMYRYSLNNNQHIFLQNPDDAQRFLDFKIAAPAQVVRVGGSGVDLNKFRPQLLPATRKFLFCGRLLKNKGIREFVDASRMVLAIDSRVKFTILGGRDNNNPDAVEVEVIARWKALDHLVFIPHTADVRPYIAAHTFVVLPSYREGLPRVLIEAGAMGRPVITCDVPGCREVVQDGKTGFLAQPRSAQDLADKMMKMLLLSDEQITEMSHAIRADMEERFDQTKVNRTYLQAIESLN